METFKSTFLREEILKNSNLNQSLGDIFELITRDYLTVEFPDYIYSIFPSAQKDGKIDIIGNSKKNATALLVQCKKNETIGLAKSGLNKEMRSLKEALSQKNYSDLYKPWEKKSISTYIYATSCNLLSASEINYFKEKIEGTFKEISKLERFSHFKEIVIMIIDWSIISSKLKSYPELYSKYFSISFPGSSTLSDFLSNAIGFKKFLKNYYYSRETFRREVGSNILIENEIFENFESASDKTGILITGEGGVGKTRLMIELGKIGEEKGYLVLKIFDGLLDIKELVQFLERILTTKILLLIDYIENVENFILWLSYIQNSTAKNKIKIIANCRNTFYERIRFKDYFKIIDISTTQDTIEKKYQNHVVKSILNTEAQFEVELFSENLIRPAIACLYLYLKKIDADSDFTQVLTGNIKFQDWLLKRIELTLSPEELLPKTIISLSCLPNTLDKIITLSDEIKSQFDKLTVDGWIEIDSENKLAVIHDIIIDELLLKYFQKKGIQTFENKFTFFLESISKNKMFFSGLKSFRRIASFLNEDEIINYLLQNESKEFHSHLISPLLVKYPTNIDLKNIASAYINKFCFSNVVSRVIDSYLVIKADLSIINEGLLNFLNKICSTINLTYYLQPYLENGGNPTQIENLVIKYLEVCWNNWHSTFLISKWIRYEGRSKIISPFITRKLKNKFTTINDDMIIKWYLIKYHDPEFILEFTKQFLMNYPMKPEVPYTIYEWLNSKAKNSGLEDVIAYWIENNYDTKPGSITLENLWKFWPNFENLLFYTKENLKVVNVNKSRQIYLLKAAISHDTETIDSLEDQIERFFKESMNKRILHVCDYLKSIKYKQPKYDLLIESCYKRLKGTDQKSDL